MHVIYVSLFLYIIKKAGSSEPKFIDLLPEKQKEAFLENIARRILEEAEVKENPDKEAGSIEVTDDQLNVHDAFVKKIMQEESDNLKRQANKTDEYSNRDNVNIGRELTKEDTKGFHYVDLTLRTEKNRTKRESSERRVFSVVSNNDDNSTENNSKESDADIQAKNFRRNTDHNNSGAIFEEGEETTNIAIVNNNIEENKTTIQDQNNEKTTHTPTTLNKNNYQETEETSQNNFKSSDVKLTNKNLSNEEITTITNYDTQRETQFTTIGSLQNSQTVEVVSKPVELETIKKIYEHINVAPEDAEESRVKEDVLTTIITTTARNADRVSRSEFLIDVDSYQAKLRELNDSDVINIEIATVKKDLPSDIGYHNVNKYPNADLISDTATEEKVVTSPFFNEEDSSSNKDKEMLIDKNTELNVNEFINEVKNPKMNKIKMSAVSKKFLKNVIDNLQLKLSDTNSKNYNYPTMYNKMKPAVHEVFEISADQPPFVKQKAKSVNRQLDKEIQKQQKLADKKREILRPDRNHQSQAVEEEPYYVPIYNHKPSNAFFNPHNLYGPNADDNEDIVDNDNDVYIINNDEGYKFPSMMPKSAQQLINEKSETKEQPFYVPIYDYSPSNAFFNPKNLYGPNLQNSNEEPDKNNIEYSEHDENEEGAENDKERNQIEWQYYYDSHKGNNLHRTSDDEETAKKKAEDKSTDEYQIGELKFLNTMQRVRHMLLEKKHLVMSAPLNISEVEKHFDVNPVLEDTNISETNNTANENTNKTALRTSSILNDDFYMKAVSKGKDENIDLDYYERYGLNYDPNEREQPNTHPKYKNYEIVEREIERDPKYNIDTPITLIYYKNPIDGKKKFKQMSNNPIQDLIESYIKTKAIAKNKKLQGFLNYDKPSKLEEKPLKVEDDVKYTMRRKKDSVLEMIEEMVQFIGDESLLKTYTQLQKIDQIDADRQRWGLPPLRYGAVNETDVYVEVIGDMLKEGNKALRNYDWLGTAVDLQSAIRKMSDMVDYRQKNEDIHPSDLELLKYILFLHSFALDETTQKVPQRKSFIMSSNKRKKHILKKPGLLMPLASRLNIVRQQELPKNKLNMLAIFLEDLQMALYDLHIALKFIAMVTTYKNQQWFENLKQIHIDPSRKQLLEIILHLHVTRLLGLIEEAAKNGVEENFIKYLEKNEKDVRRSREEFAFVLKLMDEIKLYQ